jgi:hypothetical protein
MFVSEALKTHIETSSTINLRSLILAEWNMNSPDNIFKIGNYRYRPNDSEVTFRTLPTIFDPLDVGNFYTGATDADITIDGGFTNSNTPQLFTSKKEKMNMIYSLEDCFKTFRPRSGINKATYFNNKFVGNVTENIFQRPRYYMPSRYDQFRYWTSYRTENNIERGIAKNTINGQHFIDDACPFIVYQDKIPANRIVIKMQTNIGDIDEGPFTNGTINFPDPLFGNNNKTTPTRWKIQYLNDNNWVDLYSFTEFDTRDDENNSQIISSDGYIEVEYGLKIPAIYKNIFKFAETLSSSTLLPEKSIVGYSYLVIENNNDIGTFYIYTNEGETGYETFVPEYGWKLSNGDINVNTNFVKDITNPSSFYDTGSNGVRYREFQYLRGVRVVVEIMNKFDSTFDLIEISPRLVVDISDKTIDYQTTKILSDIGTTSLPVGQLLASTGQINLFDDDNAFNTNNSNSIIKNHLRKNIKFSFYEVIVDVDNFDYYVPIKTLYSEGFPQIDNNAGTVSVQLRDLYFLLESMPAPRLLMTEVSLSYAVATMLDYIGFSNYSFKRITDEPDPIIPYFFVAPDQSVAEVLSQLAVSTQSAMFFDEYNNFIVMTKSYMMPELTQRETDFTLVGSDYQNNSGITKNNYINKQPNIISISSEDKNIFNDGKINYTTRYIQRSYGSIRQSSMVDQEKTWIYKPALLWEVSGTESTKTKNEVAAKQSKYVLGAMPLNSNLSADLPVVSGGIVINNIIDVGENVYWLTRYQGYLYANGEIIKYDAAEFNITGTGNVWISSNQEYQKYFATLPFNGKIYPTGNLRIYSEPYYQTINGITMLKPGSVFQHGRGQFGTTITSHFAGVDSYWSNNDNVRGISMKTEYLFTTKLDEDVSVPETTIGEAGVNNAKARSATRNSVIKNFMSSNHLTETGINSLQSTQSGTIQSSALVMNGPIFNTTEKPLDFVSYVYKPMNNAYRHFGTRMRIIGKIENNETRVQTPTNAIPYYQLQGSQPNQNISIGGGSGGMAIMVNPDTNVGYYFEIIALTEDNIESYLKTNAQGQSQFSINNVVFYKVKKESSSTSAIPVKLWGGLAKILVDDGRFTGQQRMASEDNTTVYDLSVEYENIGSTRRFYLYINNKLIKVVDDRDPLPIYNNMGIFVRGGSRCMFEHIYALAENYTQNTVFTVGETLSGVFGDKQINASESFRKYAMSGIIQATYLSGISSQQPPKYNMYFEEFGTIMRECAYFDIRYDRAYPALYAKISPTFNRIKGYTVSGFQADSYGAEFLIFNSTDSAISLDETTGNYLRIQGVTFTQDTTHELTIDEYFKKTGNLSDPEFIGNTNTTSSLIKKELYNKIKLSRMTYGKKEFSIDANYIQSQDDAESLMGWIINKTMDPKKSVGANIFAIPTLQLGDIVSIDYNKDGIDIISPSSSRFVVYNIEYSRGINGPSMTVYLSEV